MARRRRVVGTTRERARPDEAAPCTATTSSPAATADVIAGPAADASGPPTVASTGVSSATGDAPQMALPVTPA